MAAVLKWNGDAFKVHLEKVTAAGIVRAGTFYHAKCREAVSKPNTGKSVKVLRQTPGGNKSTRTIYPNPSKPGEPPRLRTGFGQRNVVVNHNPSEMYTRVGITANARYMLFLELGTRRVARRPWLVATLMKNKDIIGKLAASGG